MQVHKNIVKLLLRLHFNIGKIICKYITIIYQFKNFGNFKNRSIVKPIFANISRETIFLKIIPSMGYLFYFILLTMKVRPFATAPCFIMLLIYIVKLGLLIKKSILTILLCVI